VSSAPSNRDDGGFTLVELVMAIVVLFIALMASTQIIISMVSATIANRHVDLAMSVATQTMETAVAFDCGGQLVDPGWVWGVDEDPVTTPTTKFYNNLVDRCAVDTNTPTSVTASTYCPTSTSVNSDGVFNSGFLPSFDQAQADLGSRRFTVFKAAASFAHTNTGSVSSAEGALPICTTVKMSWRFIKSAGNAATADDGTNESLRLQRQVHVQWKEVGQSKVRARDLVQLSALPPDSKVAVNTGRISVYMGPRQSATLVVPITGQKLTLASDDDPTSGLVNFPFLPDGTYQIQRSGLADTWVTLSAGARSQCVLNASAIPFIPGTCRP
jgi:type II secretory pathway pseudopilin PulG